MQYPMHGVDNASRSLTHLAQLHSNSSHLLFFLALSKPTTPSFRGNSYLILPPPRIPMKDKRRGPSLYVRPREAIQISLNFSTIEPDGLLLWSEHDQSKFLGLGLENGHLKLASNLLGSNNDTVQAPASGFVADGAWHGTSVLLDRTRLELQLDGEVIFTERLPELQRRSSTTTPATTSMQRRGSKDPTISYEDVFYLGKQYESGNSTVKSPIARDQISIFRLHFHIVASATHKLKCNCRLTAVN